MEGGQLLRLKAARKAGDFTSEELFLRRGREFALRAKPRQVFKYDLYGLGDDVPAKNWMRAVARYSAATASLQRYSSSSRLRINDLKIERATAQALGGDLESADRELERQSEWAKHGLAEDGQS